MSLPRGLPKKFRDHWRRPWTARSRRSPGFRRWLRNHGYLTPNFRVEECRDSKYGTLPPDMRKPRRHARNLERLRHAIGDRPIQILSWYRTPAHNREIGGASQSRHMQGDATDHSRQWVDATGRQRVIAAAERVFSTGGLGQYPWKAIHVDSRGWRARWSSW